MFKLMKYFLWGIGLLPFEEHEQQEKENWKTFIEQLYELKLQWRGDGI